MTERRGRRPSGNYKQKTHVFSTRITFDLRIALEDAAKKNGHSLSQEAEHRLRRSFGDDRLISEKFGTRQNYALLRLLASLFDMAPGDNVSWLDDPDNFNHVVRSIQIILDTLKPSAAPKPSQDDHFLGDLNAAAIADELAAADASMPPDQPQIALNYIKADLGGAADRLKPLEGSGMGHGERARIRRGKR